MSFKQKSVTIKLKSRQISACTIMRINMNSKLFSITFFCLTFGVSTYIFFNERQNQVNGIIDKGFVENISKASKSVDVIRIKSSGGEIESAEKSYEIISAHDLTILIYGYCLSACSEYILPAAKNIRFEDSPLVGFHWSPMMNFDMLIRNGGDITNCDLPEYEMHRQIFVDNELNPDFFREVEKRLVLLKYEIVEKPNECPWKVRKFKNDFWFPDSFQLKELLKLQFSGSLCADDVEKCKVKIGRLWPNGGRFVIGNEIYVCKGKDNQ